MTPVAVATFYLLHLLGLLVVLFASDELEALCLRFEAWQARRRYDAAVREAIRLRDL